MFGYLICVSRSLCPVYVNRLRTQLVQFQSLMPRARVGDTFAFSNRKTPNSYAPCACGRYFCILLMQNPKFPYTPVIKSHRFAPKIPPSKQIA